MASRGTSFGKRERDRAKKEKQTIKAERRVERGEEKGEDDETERPPGRPLEEVLAEVEALHIQMDEGLIDAEEFADKREELMAQIQID